MEERNYAVVFVGVLGVGVDVDGALGVAVVGVLGLEGGGGGEMGLGGIS